MVVGRPSQSSWETPLACSLQRIQALHIYFKLNNPHIYTLKIETSENIINNLKNKINKIYKLPLYQIKFSCPSALHESINNIDTIVHTIIESFVMSYTYVCSKTKIFLHKKVSKL